MQPKAILAFRKRLKTCGYTNVKIYASRRFDGYYEISAIEPLGRRRIEVCLSLGQCIDFKKKNS